MDRDTRAHHDGHIAVCGCFLCVIISTNSCSKEMGRWKWGGQEEKRVIRDYLLLYKEHLQVFFRTTRTYADYLLRMLWCFCIYGSLHPPLHLHVPHIRSTSPIPNTIIHTLSRLGKEISILPYSAAILDNSICVCMVDIPLLPGGDGRVMCHTEILLHPQHWNYIPNWYWNRKSDGWSASNGRECLEHP